MRVPLLAALSLVAAACGSTAPAGSGPPSASARRGSEESLALMAECYRGITPQGSVRSLDRTDVYCSKIYRRASCARGWYELSMAFTTPRSPTDNFDGKSDVTTMVERCRADYCVAAAANQPALCAPSSPLTKASLTAFVAWLVDQELTLPEGESARWSGGMYFGSWLQ